MRRVLLSVVLLVVLAGCSEETMRQAMEPRPTTYGFERFNLPDGTPCYHVKVSGHGAKSGVTCNYGAKK